MKRSTKTGLMLALGLTMSSTFAVWEPDPDVSGLFQVRITQAAANGSGVSVDVPAQHMLSANATDRRMQALVSRVQEQLLNAGNTETLKR